MTHPCLCGADAERRRQAQPGDLRTVAGALKEEGSSLVKSGSGGRVPGHREGR